MFKQTWVNIPKKKKLPSNIVEVDPPTIARDNTKKNVELIEETPQALYGPPPEEIINEIENIQDLYGPAPPDIEDI